MENPSSPTLSSKSSMTELPIDLAILASGDGFGITILHEGSEDPQVDIVAVHGLRAHPIKSWMKGKGKDAVMWLYHLLPKDLPNARIMTYGYNSNLAKDASMGRIRDFAKGLLNAVDSYRTREDRKRPIIFVCHSLGGLVVKQVGQRHIPFRNAAFAVPNPTGCSKALVIANNERIFQHVKTATYGIIFLGTPHRGSHYANIGTALANVIKLTYPGIETQIIESLRKDSFVLRDLADDFRNLHSDFHIVSCYEQKPTKLGLIVDNDSAVLNIKGERQVPLDTDHHQIRQFAGPNDPSYKTVSNCIQRLAELAPEEMQARFNIAKTTEPLAAAMLDLELGIGAGGGSVRGLKTVHIFDIPGLLTPCFTGCKFLLDQLNDLLKSPASPESSAHDWASYRRAAIYGMPGSGKTQLALKYATSYREQYSAIFFVSAARVLKLNEGFERIVSLLDLPERSRTEPGVKIAAARAWLENSRSEDGKGWLLIVDNINPDIPNDDNTISNDKVDLVRDFLPREGTKPQGSIILTTRKPRAAERVVGGDLSLCVGVGKMDEKDAVDLLNRVSGKSNDDHNAWCIAKELGFLPLAINQAATYIKVEDIEYASFMEDFRKEKNEILEWSDDDEPQQSSSTTNIYRMAFRGLAMKSSVSADIFRLFSFFDPERIPLSLLTEGSQGVPESIELSKVIKSSIQLSKALANIRSGSLAHRLGYGEEKVFRIHDLVQYLCRQWMEPNEQREWAERAIDVVAFAYPDTLGSLETWEKAKVYLKHGLACTEHAEVLQIQSLNLGDLMVRMSWFLRQTGDLATATQLAVRAVDCAKVFGEGQRQHMNSISNLGLMYYQLSRFKEAEEQWTSALKMGKKLLGSGYVDTGIGNNLALLYYQEGRFEEAERHHLEIYMRRKDILGDHHPETLGAMGSLANTYHFQGRLKEAVDLKKRLLEDRRKHMGENHPETLGGKGSLATTYSDQGLLKEAEELQREVMIGRRDQWGVENPEYLSAKGALSYTFYLQGRLDEAKNYQREVRDARLKLWGEQHVETLGAVRHLAKTCYLQGHLGEAAELQEKAVFGMEKLLGENHPETLSIREELSNTYHDQGLLEGAEELRGQVAKQREKLWGRDHGRILQSMEAFSRKHQGFAH